MTELNLKKKIVKQIIFSLIIIIFLTLLVFLPIGIISFNKAISDIKNNTNSLVEWGLGLLPLCMIILTVEFSFFVIWIIRFLSLKRITFPSEEIKSVSVKKISVLKIISLLGLKIKTTNGNYFYIFTNSKDEKLLTYSNLKLKNTTITITCYKNSKFIKKLEKNTFNNSSINNFKEI